MIIRHDTSISNIIYLHEIVLILDKPQTGHNSYSNVLDCSHIIITITSVLSIYVDWFFGYYLAIYYYYISTGSCGAVDPEHQC